MKSYQAVINVQGDICFDDLKVEDPEAAKDRALLWYNEFFDRKKIENVSLLNILIVDNETGSVVLNEYL